MRRQCRAAGSRSGAGRASCRGGWDDRARRKLTLPDSAPSEPDPEAAVSATPEQPADLVLDGGRIATLDAARSWASALAVRDGQIVAVGSDRAIARFKG